MARTTPAGHSTRCKPLCYNRFAVVFFNYTTMQMTGKIVYYGPGLCGKTTNLLFIHQKTASGSRGEMVSLETETDRTLFFDLLPLDVGVIGGMKVRLQLYTVPGQVFYNATRKLVLKGVDGVVFVADSQISMLDSNVESLRNLETNLAELGVSLNDVPIVFQYNKRDIRSIHTVEQLNGVLNPHGAPYFEAAALHGIGVFETLKCISRAALASVRRKVLTEPEKVPTAAVTGGPTATPIPLPAPAPPRPSRIQAPARPASAASSMRKPAPDIPPVPPPAPARRPPAPVEPAANPLAQLVTEIPVPEEIPVEFAEEDTDKHVRAVTTKGTLDIQRELETLRELAASARPAMATSGSSADLERRLQDVLVSVDKDTRQEVKRKASVDVPSKLLKGASTLRLDLAFDNGGREDVIKDALSVRLVGNKRLERLTLRIDLELKSKTR